MKKLDELLRQKSDLAEKEERDFHDRKTKEIELKRKDEEKRKNDDEEARNNAIFKHSIDNVLTFGFTGALIGAIMGFAKGCESYNAGNKAFSEPFVYIPENAFNICIIGAAFGLIYGIYKGKNE